MLSANNIYKSYGKQTVLQDVSLTVEPGEIYGLIGLNGVGKTTLIKLILGLASIEKGTITIDGISVTETEARKKLAYLPEKFQPSRYLTGYEYLALTLEHYQQTLDRERADDFAERFSLSPSKLPQRISSYSKGMAQKIGLIAGLLSNCPLLILDEPMSGLDPLARIHLKKEMLTYKEAGNTIFFSSHILSDIDEICDRIAIIHNGRIIYTGTPAELKDKHPESNLERSFLHAIAA